MSVEQNDSFQEVPKLVEGSTTKSDDSQHIEGNLYIDQLKDQGNKCTILIADIRSNPITAQTVLSDAYIDLWGLYHDLLQRIPVIMNALDSNDVQRAVLKGLYKMYLREFNSLKDDVAEVYSLSKDHPIVLPAYNVENEILSDFLSEIKEYEEKNAEILKNSSVSEKLLRKFFIGLFQLLKKCLNYILKLFYMGETNDDMIFSLTPLVRMRWSAMLLTDQNANKDEIALLSQIAAKSKDLYSIIGKEVLAFKNKKAKGDIDIIEKVELQNKFSQYIKNIADTLTTREAAVLNQQLLNKSMSVLDDGKHDAFMAKLKQAIPIKDDHCTFGTQLSKQTVCVMSIVSNMIESIAVIESLLDLIPLNAFEFGLYANFVKKYGIRVFTLECFSKLDRFNEQRRRGMLRE